MAMPDLQAVWETAQREIALEGSNGCTLKRLWKLVGLDGPDVGPGGPGAAATNSEEKTQENEPHPREFVKAWLWRSIVSRRGKELFLATYNDQGESNNLERGEPEDFRLAAIKDLPTLRQEQGRVGVVASMSMRLRALGLDTATLKTVTLVSPAYLQVLEVVGRHRQWGASIAEVLDGVNSIIKSSKKNDYVEVVASQATKVRGRKNAREGAFLGSDGMTTMQLYPVYDRLASTGLIFKSVVQKPAAGNEEDAEVSEGMFRFVVLYLKRFKDSILVPDGTKLEPTAKEVYLEMLVDHLLEVAGGSGAIVPWYTVRKDLFLDKNAAGRLRNLLQKETNSPGFPIRIQLLDIHAMDYVTARKGRRLDWCVSLKHSSELEPQALKLPLGISLARSVMGLIKSRAEAGANANIMQRQLHHFKRPVIRIIDFMVKKPSTYGIWKGYTREGRNAKVQALFYDQELLSRGNAPRPAHAPTAPAPTPIKVDALLPPLTATENQPAAASGGGAIAASGEPAGSGVGGGGDGDGAGGGSAWGGAGGGGLGDVNWSDDDELDAMVDDISREVDAVAEGASSLSRSPSFETVLEGRVKFELNPVYPPEDCSDAVRFLWMQMTPKERRKNFVLHEIEQCRTIPMNKLLALMRMYEGPGPTLQKITLDVVVAELLQEGKIKRATAPTPNWPGLKYSKIKAFGTGDMILHVDEKMDARSMACHAENFYQLETAVAKELLRIKSEETRGERHTWDAAWSPDRFLVYKRKMHRTMILHRQLLRCLEKLPGHRVGSRPIDLDRVILDTPLSTFLTMFGFPPDYLHSKEMYAVLKKAEARKSTIRMAPVAIWELMRTVPWYKEALTSTLQVLYDMKVLTRIDPLTKGASASGTPSSSTLGDKGDKSSAEGESSSSGAVIDEEWAAYRHVTTQVIRPEARGASVEAMAAGEGAGSSSAAIDKFHKAMAATAAARRKELEKANNSGSEGGHPDTLSRGALRGLRRDKKARSIAAEELLRESSPPTGEIKMGLGWAVLHVELVIHTEDPKAARPRRVSGHLEWSNFWSTYQYYGTGQRMEALEKDDSVARVVLGVSEEATQAAHPLASWLLEKVPYLADQKEWGVDKDNNRPEEEERNRWHRAKQMWNVQQDTAIVNAVLKFQSEPKFAHTKPSRRGRDSDGGGGGNLTSLRQAVKPVAELLGKTAAACWRRYRVIANHQAKYFPHGQALPLPMRSKDSNTKNTKNTKKRTLEEKEEDEITSKKRHVQKTGLLAINAPLRLSDLSRSQIGSYDTSEKTRKAREEAVLAKAAGFEWVNEEGSWDENGLGGGIMPREFDQWGWTMEELAAFTAVRQLLLVPEKSFKPPQALERMKAFRPPTLQKAYRMLLSAQQIDIAQAAWAANEYSVQDSVDHEVYKMIGRHGSSLAISRGVVAEGSLRAVGSDDWPCPLPALLFDAGGATLEDPALEATRLKLTQLCSRNGTRGGSATFPPPPATTTTDAAGRPASLAVADIGSDRTMVTDSLEAVLRKRASFAVKPPAWRAKYSDGGLGVGIGGGVLAFGDEDGAAGGGGGSGQSAAGGVSSGSGGGGGVSGPAEGVVSVPGAGEQAGVRAPAGSTAPHEVRSAADVAGPAAYFPPALGGNLAAEAAAANPTAIRSGQLGEPVAADGDSRGGELGTAGGAGGGREGGEELARVVGGGGGGDKKDGPSGGQGVVSVTKYRSARSVDADVMSTMFAELKPRDYVQKGNGAPHSAGAGFATGTSSSRASDGREVLVPELEWGLTTEGGADGDESDVAGAAVMVSALKETGGKGMALSELWVAARRAVRATAAAVVRGGADVDRASGGEVERVLALVGRVLRSSEVVCVCDAKDVRYLHRENGGLWIVQNPPAAASTSTGAPPPSASAPASTPAPTTTPMEVDSMEEEEEDASGVAAASEGWKGKGKGKGKRRAGSGLSASRTSGNGLSTVSQGGKKPKVWFPWMGFEGEANLRLLNRIRQGMVAHIRSKPGCQANDVREAAEFSFLSGGETMLLLRDLVRRKVLREDVVPDTSAATLVGGWGVSQPLGQGEGGEWTTGGCGSDLDQHVRTPETTSFSLELDWQDTILEMEDMAETTATATAAK